MIRILSFVLILNILNSCSSLKGSISYGVLSGTIAGASLGNSLSPNKKSIKPNILIFGLVGGLLGGIGGSYFYKKSPSHFKFKKMIDFKEQENSLEQKQDQLDFTFQDIKVSTNLKNLRFIKYLQSHCQNI